MAKLVRECFDALAQADTDLRTAGLRLPQLDYEKASELVGLVAGLSGKPIALILDAWEQSPFVEFEFKALIAFLNHQDDWPLCHIFVGLRPDDVTWALARKLRTASPAVQIYELPQMHLDDRAVRPAVLHFLREHVPATREVNEDALFQLIDGFPGVLDRWLHDSQRERMISLEINKPFSTTPGI